MEHIVRIEAADKGHTLITWFIARHDGKAVQFQYIDTLDKNMRKTYEIYPMASDLGHHSPKPLYSGETSMPGICDVINNVCYYDGSSLNAEPFLQALARGGQKLVFEMLDEYFREIFPEPQDEVEEEL